MTLTPEQRKANVERIRRLAAGLRDLDKNHLQLAEAKAENMGVELNAIRVSVAEARVAVKEAVTLIEETFKAGEKGKADE